MILSTETIPMGALLLIMFYVFMALWIISESISPETKPKKTTIVLIMFFIFLFLVSILGIFTKIMGYNLIP
jgi:heme A synthase